MRECTHSTVFLQSPCSGSLPILPVLASVSFCNAVKTFWVPRRVMFHHFQNLAWSVLPSLRLWLHSCCDLIKAQDAAARDVSSPCICAISPEWLMVSGVWSPGQVERGWRNRCFQPGEEKPRERLHFLSSPT